MSYRGMNHRRLSLQATQIMRDAGHPVLWREYVSATTDNSIIGIGATLHYRETWVSAHMVYQDNMQMQTDGGQVIVQSLKAVSDYQFGKRDELIWNGTTYRVDSEPQPSRSNGQWTVKLERGE